MAHNRALMVKAQSAQCAFHTHAHHSQALCGQRTQCTATSGSGGMFPQTLHPSVMAFKAPTSNGARGVAHDRASMVERLKMSSPSPTTCTHRPKTRSHMTGGDVGEDSEWTWVHARACQVPGSARAQGWVEHVRYGAMCIQGTTRGLLNQDPRGVLPHRPAGLLSCCSALI